MIVIYFLIRNGAIIYIGQTQNFNSRIKAHSNKKYDYYRFIECRSIQDAKRHEKRLIRKFKPILNTQCVRNIDSLSNDGMLIKVPKQLKIAVNQYVTEKKVKGGVSGLVKRYLQRKVKE